MSHCKGLEASQCGGGHSVPFHFIFKIIFFSTEKWVSFVQKEITASFVNAW